LATSAGARTSALKPATPSLPKATVQLQAPTQPLSAASMSASQMATLKMDDEDEEESGGGLMKFLSLVGFLAACVVAYIQYDISDIWTSARDRDASIKDHYFAQIFAADPNSEAPDSDYDRAAATSELPN